MFKIARNKPIHHHHVHMYHVYTQMNKYVEYGRNTITIYIYTMRICAHMHRYVEYERIQKEISTYPPRQSVDKFFFTNTDYRQVL